MKMKALSLGAAIGFVFAITPSCGMQTTTCSASNCTGCCSNGMCVSSLTDALCGSAGNACSNCTASGQTCNTTTKSCIGMVATGGGTAATGGGTATTGGGTATTGGGTATTGGGTAATGGGTASTGGGTAAQGCTEGTATCNAGTVCVLNSIQALTGTCRAGQCSLVLQDCPANQKCVAGLVPDAGTFGPRCIPFTLGDGGVADEQPCTPSANNPEPCSLGAQCISGTCKRYCTAATAPTGCIGNSECISGVAFTDGMGTTYPGEYRLCQPTPPCNPFDQATCTDMSQGCQIFTRGAACLPAGTAMNGDSCLMASCSRGFQCVGNANAASCRAFCNLDGGMPRCGAADAGCNPLMNTGVGTCTQ